MLLREHPLMTYGGVRSWLPHWLCKAGYHSTHPIGEVGILRDVIPSNIEPHPTCFFLMENQGAGDFGAFFFSDGGTLRKVYDVLIQHRGKTMQEIGSIDLAPTLSRVPNRA